MTAASRRMLIPRSILVELIWSLATVVCWMAVKVILLKKWKLAYQQTWVIVQFYFDNSTRDGDEITKDIENVTTSEDWQAFLPAQVNTQLVFIESSHGLKYVMNNKNELILFPTQMNTHGNKDDLIPLPV